LASITATGSLVAEAVTFLEFIVVATVLPSADLASATFVPVDLVSTALVGAVAVPLVAAVVASGKVVATDFSSFLTTFVSVVFVILGIKAPLFESGALPLTTTERNDYR
jgi:hypothetical protein